MTAQTPEPWIKPQESNAVPDAKVSDTASALQQLEDDALMAEHKKGSEAAFEELVHRYQRSIFGYAYQMLRNKHIAEEITQEVFVALVHNADRYKRQGKFASYLFAIASNKIHKEWEQRRTRPKFFSLSFWNNTAVSEDDDNIPMDAIEDETACVVHAFELGEVSEAVNAALQHLSEHYREAFVLRRFMDLSYEEISEITDCPIGTIKSRVVRAERGLRPHLERFREYLQD
ncbi:MAG: RNA polymerase sigma factor [Candidatus Hydrogenedentes bacterium]|nr:RNA polymerase sigma factor [Candidatus Hydrogenedentota bacterium]